MEYHHFYEETEEAQDSNTVSDIYMSLTEDQMAILAKWDSNGRFI